MKISDRLSGKEHQGGQSASGGGGALDLKRVVAWLHNEVIDRLDMARVRQTDPAVLHHKVGAIVSDLLARRHVRSSVSPQEKQVQHYFADARGKRGGWVACELLPRQAQYPQPR